MPPDSDIGRIFRAWQGPSGYCQGLEDIPPVVCPPPPGPPQLPPRTPPAVLAARLQSSFPSLGTNVSGLVRLDLPLCTSVLEGLGAEPRCTRLSQQYVQQGPNSIR